MVDFKQRKVIFIDLDGTLADSMPVLYKLYHVFTKELGIEGSRDEFDDLVGPKLDQIAEIMVEKHQLSISPKTLSNQYHAKLRKLYLTIPLFPGALEFLKLAAHKGLRLALVTSAEEDLAKRFLEFHNISDFFEQIFTAKGLSESKPHPAIYERALAQMRVMPEETIAIEDAPSGLESARSAHIPTLPFGPLTWPNLSQLLNKSHESSS